MYDFIRPKMETYFSRHYGDQKFEFLTSVSLQIRARAHFFLERAAEEKERKNTKNVQKNSNDLKCSRGRFCAQKERRSSDTKIY